MKVHYFQSASSSTVAGTYLYDETKENAVTHNAANKFTKRTHTCGELRASDVGQTVVLCGWLEYRRMEKFAVLRDAYGHTQLLIKNEVQQSVIVDVVYKKCLYNVGSSNTVFTEDCTTRIHT